jgi:hypothetical protein
MCSSHKLCEILGSHISVAEDASLLGCGPVHLVLPNISKRNKKL